MNFNPDTHNRRSIRLKNFDYTSKGAYFINICTHGKECVLGEVINEEMILNKIGDIAYQQWLDIPKHFSNTEIDEFVLMPNHFHGILIIKNDKEGHSTLSLSCAPTNSPQISNNSRKYGEMKTGSISSIVRTYKSLTTRYINLFLKSKDKRIWQRNFYEHIIRDDKEFNQIREYIKSNPRKWSFDKENPTQLLKQKITEIM